MLPPPAPIEMMSVASEPKGIPAILRLRVSVGSPPRMSPTSKLVPPMSALMTLISLRGKNSLATCTAAAGAAAGPEPMLRAG